MNTAFKLVAERVLVGSGIARLGRRRLRDRVLVLAYHNVLPDGQPRSGDRSLHLSRHDFARQLDVLTQTHDVVPLAALSNLTEPSQRPRVIVTFDDAYEGAIGCGVDELVERRMPATIFVSPALLGGVTWWDILAENSGGVVPEGLRHEALHTLGGRAEAILATARSGARVGAAKAPLAPIGTELQLSRAASRPGITIASHTWSHPNLSSLRGPALDAELSRPLQWLRSRFPTVVPWLSYPYGLFSETVQRAAEASGYQGAFRIDGGWIPRGTFHRYAIPRLNIPAGLSTNGFRLRLAGL